MNGHDEGCKFPHAHACWPASAAETSTTTKVRHVAKKSASANSGAHGPKTSEGIPEGISEGISGAPEAAAGAAASASSALGELLGPKSPRGTRADARESSDLISASVDLRIKLA